MGPLGLVIITWPSPAHLSSLIFRPGLSFWFFGTTQPGRPNPACFTDFMPAAFLLPFFHSQEYQAWPVVYGVKYHMKPVETAICSSKNAPVGQTWAFQKFWTLYVAFDHFDMATPFDWVSLAQLSEARPAGPTAHAYVTVTRYSIIPSIISNKSAQHVLRDLYGVFCSTHVFITSAEARRLCFYLCLSVCLSAELLKKLWTDFGEICWRAGALPREQLIRFLQRSGSQSRCRVAGSRSFHESLIRVWKPRFSVNFFIFGL